VTRRNALDVGPRRGELRRGGGLLEAELTSCSVLSGLFVQ